MSQAFNRRRFVATTAAAGLGVAIGSGPARGADKPALLGGKPVRTAPFPSWPVMDEREEKALLAVLRSGKWFRGDGRHVEKFEETYAQLAGAKCCVATNGGTTALVASLGALGIGPGDEVIVTPYTFIASVTSIMLHFALPIFVDVDPQTFQIDAGKIEAAITYRTAAILPVHIGGSPADMDAVLAVAGKHKLPVVEDACHALLAEWRNRKLGTLGTTGCFSFQVSKNLPSGEGGAVLTDDRDLAERIYAFHNNCRARTISGHNFRYTPTRAANFRMTEFQGALLLSQLTRLEEQMRTREENARYLTGLLQEIPCVAPATMYDGCTRSAWHIYMLRYKAEECANLPRAKFLQALLAEGIPSSSGYSPVPWESLLKEVFGSRGGRRVFPPEMLASWPERCHTPENERLCQEAVWFRHHLLLGPRSDMDQIAEAIRKVHAHAGDLARA